MSGFATKRSTAEVKVPVHFPCVESVTPHPASASPTLPPDAGEAEEVLDSGVNALLHFNYEGRLEVVIAGGKQKARHCEIHMPTFRSFSDP